MAELIGAIIWLLFLGGLGVGLVWAIVDRIKQKNREDFDQREN